jgi:uncharacterized membrane protein (DUF373 family)
MKSTGASDGTDQPGSASPPQQGRRGSRYVGLSISALEHAQDAVAVSVGIVLIGLAIAVLVSGVVDFADGKDGSIQSAASVLLDRVLLVLILVEIVYTVVLTLRAHRLVAQPFIVIGLIAVIRRVLVVFTPQSHVTESAADLALLIGMVAVFVAALVAVSFIEKEPGLGIGRRGSRGVEPAAGIAGAAADASATDGNGTETAWGSEPG